MLPTLLLSVVWAQAEPPKDPPSLYQAVVSKPNPDNGYENFLRALDFLKDNRFRSLAASLINDPKKPVLEGRRQLVSRFAFALNAVRAGLRKKVFNPQSIVEPTTSFPEVAWMPDMTQLFLAEAGVSHAYGNSAASLQSLFDAYEFNSAIQRSGPLEPYLGGIEPKSKVLAELVRRLPGCSLPELASIEKWAVARLAATDLLDSLTFEKANVEGQLDNVVAGKWRNRTDRENSLLQQLGALSFSDRQLARGLVEQDVKHALGLWAAVLKLPESNWRRPDFPEYSQYGAGFVQQLNAQVEPAMKGLAVERSKLRMILAACRLYVYRWNYERFPDKLLDAIDQSLALDPLTGRPFVYESGPSGVKLSSSGSPISGPVSLVDGKKDE